MSKPVGKHVAHAGLVGGTRHLDDGVPRRHDRHGDDKRLVSLECFDQSCLIVEINGLDRDVARWGSVATSGARNDRDRLISCLNQVLGYMFAYATTSLFEYPGLDVRQLLFRI